MCVVGGGPLRGGQKAFALLATVTAESGFTVPAAVGAPAVAQGDDGMVRAARDAFAASMSTTFTVGAIGVPAAAVLATLVMRDGGGRKAGIRAEGDAEARTPVDGAPEVVA
ncbi:hypothetical protein ACIO93_28350 [Streptomyces sp. NPDC087903]|uniref:hypothetical protein n=1 Tax=Streptomyces sp. NPDC087903 TaxID=3365819 RepID=UPI0038061811